VNERPQPPPELGEAGRRLWEEVVGGLSEWGYLDARDQRILATACAQADQNAALEKALKEDGLTVRGAAGQWKLNSAAVEARQGRVALSRLLGEVCLERVRRPLEGEDDDEFDALLRGGP
jgi:P27 family predicted phage terminase small subunit